MLGRRVSFLLTVACLMGLMGCQLNPATGRKSFNVLSDAQEIQMGTEAQPQFLRDYGGEIPSKRLNEYVRGIGQSLAAVSERPGIPWEFHAVNSAQINAFALPGGKIFITRGLLEKLSSEAELAAVLGHEIGHVTAKHQGQQISQQLIVTGIIVGVSVAANQADEKNREWLRILGVGTQVGGTLYLLSFSRDDENEADQLGLRYMTRLGYNPVAMLRVMEVLKKEAGSGGGPEWLSTHPAPDTRIGRINALIKQNYPDYDDRDKWQFKFEAYQANVRDELAKLGTPKDTRRNPQGQSLRHR